MKLNPDDRFGPEPEPEPVDGPSPIEPTAEPAHPADARAPGWRLTCPRCGRSAPAGRHGVRRLGAPKACRKRVGGYCRGCGGFRMLHLHHASRPPDVTGGRRIRS